MLLDRVNHVSLLQPICFPKTSTTQGTAFCTSFCKISTKWIRHKLCAKCWRGSCLLLLLLYNIYECWELGRWQLFQMQRSLRMKLIQFLQLYHLEDSIWATLVMWEGWSENIPINELERLDFLKNHGNISQLYNQ